MHMTRGPNKHKKWGFGVWLGLVAGTQEAYVGTPHGVVRSWTVKRIAKQDRWKADEVMAVRGTTQRPDPGKRRPHDSHRTAA